MKNEMFESLTRLSKLPPRDDWKKSLDSLFAMLRKDFLFDNLAIYLVEKAGSAPEVVYARAAGRGRSQEADVSWGEEIANQVIGAGKTVIFAPPEEKSSEDRIRTPYLLGLPLEVSSQRGALVFIRFGGPKYADDQMPLAVLAAIQSARILEQRLLKESLDQLEFARHRAQLQDDFIATISHELHTPLGFIKGYTTSLLRSDTVWDTATQREFLTIIDEESDHLLVLIDRMLDSARLQSGSMAMDFQPVRLDALLRDVALHIQDRQKDLKVILDLEPAPPIQADNVRLTEVFDNLFDNAIKYAPGAPITMTLKCYDDHQTITFADTGPGISPEHLPFLFERFYRVPGNPAKRGTGLGLFICKQIIHAHNGQVSVRTAPDKGTAFQIELPVGKGVA